MYPQTRSGVPADQTAVQVPSGLENPAVGVVRDQVERAAVPVLALGEVHLVLLELLDRALEPPDHGGDGRLEDRELACRARRDRVVEVPLRDLVDVPHEPADRLGQPTRDDSGRHEPDQERGERRESMEL